MVSQFSCVARETTFTLRSASSSFSWYPGFCMNPSSFRDKYETVTARTVCRDILVRNGNGFVAPGD
jgi:hypothetical protein